MPSGSVSSAWRVAAGGMLCLLAMHGARAAPTVSITGQVPGPTPFVQYVFAEVGGGTLADVGFSVTPRAGSFTRPVAAYASAAYLAAHGGLGGSSVIVPVFGLYAGTTSTVALSFGFTDGSTTRITLPITTAAYVDPCPEINAPVITNNRTATADLDFDFFILKDYCSRNAPAVFDTDGQLRGVGFAGVGSFPGELFRNGVYTSDGGTGVNRLDLYGIVTKIGDYAGAGITYTNHHNIDVGRHGLVVDVNTATDVEADAIEIDGTTGAILNRWDMAAIIGDAMRAGGDDPGGFVHADGATDWFHMNATAYDPAENALIVSSRQNFVIAVDYDTPADGVKKIHWILGDATKLWGRFPSLRRYALTVDAATPVPIGQHAVSIDSAGDLLLFNDGYGSAGISPPGISRGYSTANSYRIDAAARTATGVYAYRPDPSLYSPVCGSAYEVAPSSHLVDFATAGPYSSTTIQGLGANNRVVFQMQFAVNNTCGSGWNASPIPSLPVRY
ncbi:MAG: aryl-sulfate sulfotransferase [Gluconacetobacter diazotrophicus]|nr:aryl-sulfate sulfotransferase [Gluconacetobacter diazotrophicus]